MKLPIQVENDEYDALQKTCARRAREYDRLEAAAYEYASIERMDRPVLAAIRKHAKVVDELPKEFPGIAVGTILTTSIFGSETSRRRFLSRSDYRAEDREAFEALWATPWRIAFLRVEERVCEDFFSIRILGDADPALLYSPAMEKIEMSGRSLILSGLFGDEACLQTYGPVIDLPAFDFTDIETFARLAAPDSYAASGLNGVLGRDPLPFLLLIAFGQHGISFGSGDKLRYASGGFRYDETFAEEAGNLGPSEAAKGIMRMNLGAEDRFDSFTQLVLDGKKHRAMLVASSAEEYRGAARKIPLLGKAPDEPEYLASLPMILAIEAILGKPFPGLEKTGKNGKEPKTQSKESGELDALNAAMREYLAAANGTTQKPDTREIARKYGVDPVQFKALVGRLESDMEKRFHIDVPGGIEGFVPPPPALRMSLADALAESSLFVLRSDDELDRELAKREPRYRDALPEGTRGAVTAARLPGILERASKALMGNSARTVLAYTFLMLLEKGDGFRPAGDYGSELLKTFWQILIDERNESEIREFLQKYSLWVRQVLVPFGLVSVEGKPKEGGLAAGEFHIKRSPFMERWIGRK